METIIAWPCSKLVYQVTPMPANNASSSLRNPGVLRREPPGKPTASGEIRSRRVRRQSYISHNTMEAWGRLRVIVPRFSDTFIISL